MSDFFSLPSKPEQESVVLGLPAAKIELNQFTEYSFNSNFLTPTDGWSFTIAEEHLSAKLKDALVPGVEVELTVNNLIQCSGYIDSVEVVASRSSGIEYRIEGRDRLAQVVDACADPTQSFKDNQTLLHALKTLFGPFGWTRDDQFTEENTANRNVKTGAIRNKTRKSEGKGFGRKAIKAYQLHQLRPFSREGAFAFASRIAQRFGLWIWSTSTGNQIVVSKPNFELDPIQTLRRNNDGLTTNVLEGTVKFDISDQPNIIVADSYAQNGEFGRGRCKTIMINTAVWTDDDAFAVPFERYKTAQEIRGHAFTFGVQMYTPRCRVLYLHDDESQNQEQLNNFVRREMALLQRKSLTVNYTVEGHGQIVEGNFVPWTVDTVVKVEDDIAGLHEDLYVLGRTFNKSRSGGTTTRLELIRLNTIEFGEPIAPAEPASKFQEKAKRSHRERRQREVQSGY